MSEEEFDTLLITLKVGGLDLLEQEDLDRLDADQVGFLWIEFVDSANDDNILSRHFIGLLKDYIDANRASY